MSDPAAALADRLQVLSCGGRLSRDQWLDVAREAVVWHEEQLRSCVVIPLMNLPKANNP